MSIKKILLVIVIAGILVGGVFAYMVYSAFFISNTQFDNEVAYVHIPSDSNFEQVEEIMEPLLKDLKTFGSAADKKGYSDNVKAGKYAINKGMNNNDIVNSLRSGNIPVKVAFNNQETLADLAGRISLQIEADSITLLSNFDHIFV